MPHSRYLTIVVQNKDDLAWEVMIEDIRLAAPREKDLVDGIVRWTAKREAVYPAQHWRAWTLVTELHGQWRRAFAKQNKLCAPPSSVRPAARPANG